MVLLACILDRATLIRVLGHLGLPTEAPMLAPARTSPVAGLSPTTLPDASPAPHPASTPPSDAQAGCVLGPREAGAHGPDPLHARCPSARRARAISRI